MQQRHLLYALMLIPFLLLSSTCEKNTPPDPDPVDQLPPATTTGANTFGCLLNGEVWTNSFGSWLQDNLDANYSIVHKKLNISAQDTEGEILQAISMAAFLEDVGLFPFLGVTYGNRPAPCRHDFIEQDLQFDENNFLEITRLDLEERIVSGHFAFVLVDDLCGDTLRFTDGRFDLRI